MKNRVEISLLILLFVFFISIEDPILHLGYLLKKIPTLEQPAESICIRQVLPEDARILFFSRTDGTVNWNATNFLISRSLYNLVPRMVEYREHSPVDMQEFKWFLAYDLEADAVDQIVREYHLQVLQTCNNMTVLGRTN
ncbi:MAG: hypothetical protein LUO89_04575 [Methanothrix sp.]|nr:hypothetical protein [Methanothrix sp.]